MAFTEELFDIFSWLPAKSLYRLSSVCKSSKELLSDDFFIRKQFKNMQLVPDRDFFIIQKYRNGNLESHALSSKNSSAGPPPESLDFLENHGNIIASSNGLLCCRSIADYDEYPLFLFNPTTWSCLPIPILIREQLVFGDQKSVSFSCAKKTKTISCCWHYLPLMSGVRNSIARFTLLNTEVGGM
ncbi:UNVERIFIED_CONTAM: hypothetical protein Sradi_5473800 [Sesamum radiatum]|uniref:F-box domain-containing protein n=1 Tax=Sesamum radiatum TaxID=300843 RepID=A0AAW2LDY5_SESRA